MEIKSPIFLVGFPRSGTTYLQTLLQTQGDVISLPETHLFSCALRYVDAMCISADALPYIIDCINDKMKVDVRTYLDDILKADKVDANSILWAIVLAVTRLKESDLATKTVLEKTPAHILFTDPIRSVFPNAKFVVLFRDPHKSIFSYIEKLNPYLQEKKGGGRSLIDLCFYWQSCVDASSKLQNSSAEVFLLKYESLLSDLDGQMQDLCHFLDIDFDVKRLSDFSEKSSQVIQDHETWKRGNQKDNYVQSHYQITFWQRLVIRSIACRGLIRLGYVKRYDPIFAFISWMLGVIRKYYLFLMKKCER